VQGSPKTIKLTFRHWRRCRLQARPGVDRQHPACQSIFLYR
jgi:hypothetical protein